MNKQDHGLTLLSLFGMALLSGVTIDFQAEMIWHDQQRIEQLILLAIAAVGAATVWRSKLTESWTYFSLSTRAAIVLFFLVGALSSALAPYPRMAALEVVVFFLLLVSAMILAVDSKNARCQFDIWATRLILGLAFLIATKVLMGYVAFLAEGVKLDTEAMFSGTFSNRRVFGQVATLFIPLLTLPLLEKTQSNMFRLSAFVLLVVWWVLLIASGTRGSWFALVGGALLTSVVAWRYTKKWLTIQVFALMTGLGIYTLLFVVVPAWIGGSASIENRWVDIAHLSGRDVLWNLAIHQIKLDPWLGIGPMHFASLHSVFGAHPHNAVLQLVAEWGVFAVPLIVVIGLALVRSLFNARQVDVDNSLRICLTISLFAAAIQSMVDGVIVIPYTQLCLVLIVGWTIGVANRHVEVKHCKQKPLARSLPYLMAFGVAVAMLAYGVFPETFYRVQITEAYLADGNKSLLPRFWGVGEIP